MTNKPQRIQAAVTKTTGAPAANGMNETGKQSLAVMMSALLDSEGYRKRFDELLGRRAPQFISSVVSLVNGDDNLKLAFTQSPLTVIQAALRAATYDLPIDPGLGYAYIVPFKNKKKDGTYAMEATFIMGYKGQRQLAMRTGAYQRLNVVDVREGELLSYDPLTEDIELSFIEDEEEREQAPIIGWCGYFRLMNGMEKTIFMSKKQIDAHERRHRKGQYQGKGWREDYNAMAEKTVSRRLLGKWGLMSIDYQTADRSTIAAAEAIASGRFDDMDDSETSYNGVIDTDATVVYDEDTGEVLPFGDGPKEDAPNA